MHHGSLRTLWACDRSTKITSSENLSPELWSKLRKTGKKKTTLKGLRIPEGCNSRFAIKGHHKETAGEGGGNLGHAVSAQVFSLELCQTTQEQKRKLCLNFVPFQNGHSIFFLKPKN